MELVVSARLEGAAVDDAFAMRQQEVNGDIVAMATTRTESTHGGTFQDESSSRSSVSLDGFET
jgi:hypothetical protein